MTGKLIPRLCGSDQSRRERKVEELVSFALATSATTPPYASIAYSSDSAWKWNGINVLWYSTGIYNILIQ